MLREYHSLNPERITAYIIKLLLNNIPTNSLPHAVCQREGTTLECSTVTYTFTASIVVLKKHNTKQTVSSQFMLTFWRKLPKSVRFYI